MKEPHTNPYDTGLEGQPNGYNPNEPVYWLSPLGGFDDFGHPYNLEPGGVMYDARTAQGPWANMTPESFRKHGLGRLGTGWGQKYVKQPNGRWLKVEG